MNEIWLPIQGFVGLYEVSDLGRVRSLDRRVCDSRGFFRHLRGCVLKPQSQPSGHLHVNLSREGVKHQTLVHDIVTRTFLGVKPKGAWVRHLNGAHALNSLWNLEYNTPQVNVTDMYVHGSRKTGSSSHLAKHSTALVTRIRKLKGSASSQVVAEKLGVKARYVRRLWANEIRRYGT